MMQQDSFEYSLPWTFNLPYMAYMDVPPAFPAGIYPGQDTVYGPILTAQNAFAYAYFAAAPPATGMQVQNYVCARDDFAVGYLIPPLYYSGVYTVDKVVSRPKLRLKDLTPSRQKKPFFTLAALPAPKPDQKVGFF